jgi:hypothetical protein
MKITLTLTKSINTQNKHFKYAVFAYIKHYHKDIIIKVNK